MKRPPLWRVSIATTPEAGDAVAEFLGVALERPAVSYLDAETGRSTVTVFLAAKPAAVVRKTISAGLAHIKRCGLKIGAGKIAISKIRHEDWAESWKRHFKPIEINPRRDQLNESENKAELGTRGTRPSGRSLLVKPSWSKRKPRKNQVTVVLDPGLSFGTGQHPTTAFCLREIVAATPRRQTCDEGVAAAKSFLDIGTGSGILAISAAKLGYKPVRAFDFDTNAVEIARENARMNNATGNIQFWRGDVAKLPLRPAQKSDLVCANLISNLLISERKHIAAQLNCGGKLVLSGILKSEFGKVRAAFEHLRLKLVSSNSEREWRSGSFQRTQ